MKRFVVLGATFGLVGALSTPVSAIDNKTLPGKPDRERPAVHVDPVDLSQVQETIINGLNIGVVVSDQRTADGVQKAADVWGLHIDLFVTNKHREGGELLTKLVRNGIAAVITDQQTADNAGALSQLIKERAQRRGPDSRPVPVIVIGDKAPSFAKARVELRKDGFDAGFEALRVARSEILERIPKYDELFNISFPITPIPDSFYQPTKFPYPDPVLRSVRTVSSASASAHAHTSCHAVAKLGNMIHRTTRVDDEIFLLGFEGGNLAIKAVPGAVSPDKLAAVMTSYVIAVRGNGSERRDLLSENDGLPTSAFTPAIHVPEELEAALRDWKDKGNITGYELTKPDEVMLRGFKGADRRFRASFFMISSDRHLKQPDLHVGVDKFGRWTFELTSTQGFIQLFGEVPMKDMQKPAANPEAVLKDLSLASAGDTGKVESVRGAKVGEYLLEGARQPRGGLMTEAGAMVGSVVGFPLGHLLQKVDDPEARFQPYILTVEGGFLAVSPETELTPQQIKTPVARFDIDERGPLGSDQTILVTLVNGDEIVFRRTVLNYSYVDQALSDIRREAWISGWEYVGARGRGLAANVVLHNFLGKHRKFMSSLNTWPSTDRPDKPYVRWYVDGMQRLNFSIVTPEGWRQEFVEVPLRVPPIPRDVQLYSGESKLD